MLGLNFDDFARQGRKPMTTTSRPEAALTSLDPVWAAVREGAEAIADAEPALANLVISTILNHDSFEVALISRLAAALDHEIVSGELIRQTLATVVERDANVAAAARTDLAATLERDPACHRAVEPLLFFKGYMAIQTHRFAHSLFAAGRRDFAFYLQSRASQTFQVDINPTVPIGKGVMLDHGTGVVIGETATVGDHVSILQGVTLGGTGKAGGDRHPKVGTGVLIGAGAKILGNINIGEGARIAAGSVVLKDVPPHKTVAGVPARVIGDAGCAEPALVMDQMVLSDDLRQKTS
jgi:serine O-acetyltransferase